MLCGMLPHVCVDDTLLQVADDFTQKRSQPCQ